MALASDPPPPFEALLEEFAADGRLVHIEHLPERPLQPPVLFGPFGVPIEVQVQGTELATLASSLREGLISLRDVLGGLG